MDGTGFIAGWRALYAQMKPERRRVLLLTLLLMFAGAVAEIATVGAIIPFLAIAANQIDSANWAMELLNRLSVSLGAPPIVVAGAIMILAAVVAASIRAMLTWVSQKFIFSVGYDLGVEVYARMLHRPYAYHVLNNTSKTVSAIQKVQMVLQGVLIPGMAAMTASIVSVFIVVALIIIEPVTALVASITLGTIYFIISAFTRNRLRLNSRTLANDHTARIQAVQEGLGGIRDVILDRSQHIFLAKFAHINSRIRDAGAMTQFISTAPKAVVEGFTIILIVGISLMVDSRPGGLVAALPTLGALAIGAQRLLPQIQQMFHSWSQVIGNQAALIDVLELIEGPPPAARMAAASPIKFETDIQLNQVTFTYPESGTKPALDALDLRIEKSERVGFIGKSGSGKSTLVDLLMGLLGPSDGSIMIDGIVLDDNHVPSWQAQIAHVPQAIFLADSTLAENIAFGDDPQNIDLMRVEEAARAADLHEHIASLPEGYLTPIGERGIRLSGGQRQRIGVARALYKRANVLVLDEATSALDDQTERSVMQSIDGLSSELTVIMIAHRLSTLKGCDRIIRIDNGKIVEIGTYKDIMRGENPPVTQPL